MKTNHEHELCHLWLWKGGKKVLTLQNTVFYARELRLKRSFWMAEKEAFFPGVQGATLWCKILRSVGDKFWLIKRLRNFVTRSVKKVANFGLDGLPYYGNSRVTNLLPVPASQGPPFTRPLGPFTYNVIESECVRGSFTPRSLRKTRTLQEGKGRSRVERTTFSPVTVKTNSNGDSRVRGQLVLAPRWQRLGCWSHKQWPNLSLKCVNVNLSIYYVRKKLYIFTGY